MSSDDSGLDLNSVTTTSESSLTSLSVSSLGFLTCSLPSCESVLNEMRGLNQLCDVVIECDDSSRLPVHKALLSGLLALFF